MNSKTLSLSLFLSAIFLLMILLPLCGAIVAGEEVRRYLEFPPLTRYVEHPGFSWPVFIAMALFVLAVVSPAAKQIITNRSVQQAQDNAAPFPRWGWGAVFLCTVSWVMAWSRFDWFADYQIFTFSPLWFGYIGIVNGLTCMRSGRCMLTHHPKYLLALFCMSGIFWWYFEYLNRYVQNWYYIGIEGLSPLQYTLFATLPFTTVLPAVMGTYELLATYPQISAGITQFRRFDIKQTKLLGGTILVIAAAGLFGIGIWPQYFYPLLWLSPLFIITGLQCIFGRKTIFSQVREGNWQEIFLLALSALICGFFWELWNFFSYAKWIYSIPFVQKFHIFEMPVLGYAGYLPFGLECGLVAEFCRRTVTPRPGPSS